MNVRSSYLHTTIELIIGLIALLTTVKIIGKRQMSQITSFDFISAIVLGELLGNAVYDQNINVFNILFALSIWSILLIMIEKLSQKFIQTRKTLQGTPSFIVYDGKFDYKRIQKEGLDFGEVLALLRDKNIFSIQDVDYVLLETNGDISIINNSERLPILTLPIILDGEMMKGNLKYANHDENWLLKKIKEYHVNNIHDIIYAEWNINDEVYIQKRVESNLD